MFEYTLEEHLTHSNSHVQSNLDYLYQAKILDVWGYVIIEYRIFFLINTTLE